MKSFCYLNGKILPSSETNICFADIGLQRGYGVFDYLRTYNGRLFHFNDHISRFHKSANELMLEISISDEKIKQIAEQLIKKSDLKNPAIRLLLTGGISNIDLTLTTPNFIISAENLTPFPEEMYINGSTLISYNFQRELPYVKSLNYMNSIRLEPLKKEKGVDDILYYSTKGITECPRSSFFIIRGNTLITAKNDILFGISRKIILNLTKDKFNIEERRIDLDELTLADEAFCTSTRKKVMPVVKIDDFMIGNGKVGKRTTEIMNLFNEYTKST